VKQTLFAILEPELPGSRFLDLFAGSGAAGIEALSRGAAHATFVERDARAIGVIRANLERARFADTARATVARADAVGWLDALPVATTFDVVVIDPPYDQPEQLAASMEALAGHLAPGARAVAKHFWRSAPPSTVGLLASDRVRRFGETALTFYRRRDDASGTARPGTEGA
jgi:16S rRNA (guanine966-N2)-methyltransferase